MHYADRLQAAIDAKKAPVCAGFDPRVNNIPPEFIERAKAQHGATPAAIQTAVCEFCLEVLDLVAPHVPAIKPQSAFFEALGPGGVEVLHAVCAKARELGLLVIADVKRGDIGSTAEAYAQALFGESEVQGITLPSMHADAATINPYLGADSIEPFVQRASACDAGLYILARTSNPGSAEFQQLELKQGGLLVEEVARKISDWGKAHIGDCGFSNVGVVVGATHAESAARMRELMPHTLFLVPGWGAQGGAAATVRACFNKEGKGAIVNSSRGVMHAYASGPFKDHGLDRWREAVSKAAEALNKEIAAIAAEPAA
jgi:orotidine-5'-phosphate decarboxylase